MTLKIHSFFYYTLNFDKDNGTDSEFLNLSFQILSTTTFTLHSAVGIWLE